jgi:isoleucyl-tRNA synthetase
MRRDLTRGQASFAPFFSEHVYQTLRLYIDSPAALNLGDDLRSVHFLPFPEVRAAYADRVVERRVKAMQDVVTLVRTLRTVAEISLKTPLDEVVVYHREPQYREDLETLRTYVEGELNVRTMRLTDDEALCGVQWVAIPDFGRLGRRVGKSMPAVKKELAELSSAAVRDFLARGVVTVAGHELTSEDATIALRAREAGATCGPDYMTSTDGGVAVALSTTISASSVQERTAKELLNRIQRARKAAGLVATDRVDVYLASAEPGVVEALLEVWREHNDLFQRMTVSDARQLAEGTEALWTESVTIEDRVSELMLVKVA